LYLIENLISIKYQASQIKAGDGAIDSRDTDNYGGLDKRFFFCHIRWVVDWINKFSGL